MISVIIPAHNREVLVADAVDSALGQAGVRTEVIVVDDASTDGTSQVLRQYGTAIRVLTTDGIERGAARNMGASHAAGSLVAFLDSDDYWEPGKLQRQLEATSFDCPSVTGVIFEDAEGRVIRSYVPPADSSVKVYETNPYLAGPSSILLPISLFFEIGGFPEEDAVQGVEDWLLFMKLCSTGNAPQIVSECLVHYRVHSENFTSDISLVERAMWNATEWATRNVDLQPCQLRQLKVKTATVIARQYGAALKLAEAIRWLRCAFRGGASATALRGSAYVIASVLWGFKNAVHRFVQRNR